MRTVYRDVLSVDSVLSTSMAPGAEIVHVAPVGKAMVEFWFLTDNDWELSSRQFVVTGTGHEAPDGGRYIGCAGRNTAGLVWHLWEI